METLDREAKTAGLVIVGRRVLLSIDVNDVTDTTAVQAFASATNVAALAALK